jgi:hypothetical protein
LHTIGCRAALSGVQVDDLAIGVRHPRHEVHST